MSAELTWTRLLLAVPVIGGVLLWWGHRPAVCTGLRLVAHLVLV